MSSKHVEALLAHSAWISPELGWSGAKEAWIEARDQSDGALDAWHRARTAQAYAIYRAAADREDAAQEALARMR